MGSPVMLRERFQIYYDQPLPEFDSPCAKAYRAEDKRDPAKPLFALICRSDLPVRINVMRAMKSMQSPGLLEMAEWGVGPWPPEGAYCMMVVYQRPLGGRVSDRLGESLKRSQESELIRRMLRPLITTLMELRERGITHRSIRPSNMFFLDEKRQRIVLGDCVTSPPAYDQPLLYEPIENGMTMPSGRGAGHFSDDVYALGASLAEVLLGRELTAGRSDDLLLKHKILYGSYVAIIGEERLPLSQIEILRGTLADDPEERWNPESLDLWLSGRRLSPQQTKLETRTQRAFDFNGKEYNTARELAMAFVRNWDLAMAPVIDGKLEIWMRRAVEDKDRADAITTAVRLALTGPAGEKKTALDTMLARVCIILDPRAPIRYKGLAVMPDGFGAALACAMREGGTEQRLLAEMLQRDIPKLWFGSRADYNPDNSTLESTFRALQEFLADPSIGSGIERALYELNESVPCLSPLVAPDYVVDIRELLPALNNASKRFDPRTPPVDRHIAAFVAARFKYDVDRQLTTINERVPERQAVGMLSLLALLQWRLGPETLYGLASWMGGQAAAIINTYHGRDTRQALEREVPKVVRRGSVVELFQILDNAEERQRDHDWFRAAQRRFIETKIALAEAEGNGEGRQEAALQMGQKTAAVASVVIGLLSMSLFVFLRMI